MRNETIPPTENENTLYCLAHPAEASALLKNYRPVENSFQLKLYQAPKLKAYVLLTGEGPLKVFDTLPLAITLVAPKLIVNLGIAGALRPQNLKLGEIYAISEVRGIKNADPLKTHFHTYPLKTLPLTEEKSYICVTAEERILDEQKLKVLAPLGDVVDRELWAIARVGQNLKIPVAALKLISDIPGLESCDRIQARASTYAQQLSQYLAPGGPAPAQGPLPPEFSFTQFQKSRYQKLHPLLAQKTQREQDLFWSKLKGELASLKRPKARTEHMLEALEALLYPEEFQLRAKVAKLFEDFKEKGNIAIQGDKELERDEIAIQFKCKNERDLKVKLDLLSSFPFEEYRQLLSGVDPHGPL